MFKVLIDFARPFTLIVPALGVCAGAFAGLHSSALIQSESGAGLPFFAVMLLGAFAAAMLNAGSNAINQVCDRRIDAVSKPERPIPSGRVSVRQGVVIALVFYLIAIGALMLAGMWANLPVLIIFGTALIATLAYSVPPIRTRNHALTSSITISIPRGFLLLVAGYALVANPFELIEPWVLGATPGLYLLGAAATKDFADMEGDGADGVRSLPIVFGVEKAIKLIAPFLVAPFALLALAMGLQASGVIELISGNPLVLCIAGVLLAAWGFSVMRMLLRDPHALSTTENHPAWKQMYLMMMLYYVSVIAAYAA